MTKRTALLAVAIACLLAACAPRHRVRPLPSSFPTSALKVVPPSEYPDFLDDMDDASLKTAVAGSLAYYNDLPSEGDVFFGQDVYTIRQLRESLKKFARLIDRLKTPVERRKAILDRFILYKSTGLNPPGNVIFSAYYEHALAARLSPNSEYIYPLYAKPHDLVKVDLGQFNPQWKDKTVVARYDGNFLYPYPTREEIDTKKSLQGKGLEIAWAKDPYDIYLLQVEGSGWLKIDGSTQTVRIRYAASNGHPYKSIGLSLIEKGKMSQKEISVMGIRQYFAKHPNERRATLNTNPRYIFFHLDRGPEAAWAMGSLHVPLTAGRSVATDPALFPRGALGWVKTRLPILNDKGEVIDTKPFSRFVLNQDEGGAIKGPARLDLFVGSAEDMIRFAGHFWQAGELYFLVLK